MGKEPTFNELSLEQRRRLIDIQQKAESLRHDAFRLRHELSGSMAWKTRGGVQYLYHREGRIEKSLGRRSPETEKILATFMAEKNGLLERRAGIRGVLKGWAPVTKALRLGRVPLAVARLLRRLDEAELLGDRIQISGGYALLAYEAMTGLVFDNALIDDVCKIELVATIPLRVMLGHLRVIDPTFVPTDSTGSQLKNAAGVKIIIVTAPGRHRSAAVLWRGSTAVGADGMPVWIAALHPAQLLEESLRDRRLADRAKALSYLLEKFSAAM